MQKYVISPDKGLITRYQSVADISLIYQADTVVVRPPGAVFNLLHSARMILSEVLTAQSFPCVSSCPYRNTPASRKKRVDYACAAPREVLRMRRGRHYISVRGMRRSRQVQATFRSPAAYRCHCPSWARPAPARSARQGARSGRGPPSAVCRTRAVQRVQPPALLGDAHDGDSPR